jgi:Uma2 family endonuclease
MLDLDVLALERPRRLKRTEYAQLVGLGTFEDEQVELIDGVIVEMPPGDPQHATPIQELTRILVPPLAGRALVRVQLDFLAAGESQPLPDVAIVPCGDYRRVHPSRAHCIVEVSHSSLRKDRLLKAPLYAASNVEEYWLVNVPARSVEVFRNSDGTRYRELSEHDESEILMLARFPDVRVEIAEIF